MHLCERQSNLTRRACCQLVLLLNDTTKVPLCNVEFLTQNYSDSSFYSPPIFLDEPSEVREDHVTFLLGIMVLMLVACGCIFTLSRLTKPRFRINYGSISNYDFMMWMPSKTNRSLGFFFFQRSCKISQIFSCSKKFVDNKGSAIDFVNLLDTHNSATLLQSSKLVVSKNHAT
ncbi:hypothetical protein Y032_0158g3262 [Ancylostoma ceylanicum]|uniref:Uncharacterized protein n=1 Tax=Ancylostoma ceylanicum TaxID=53326 RepID=A0A016SZ77_9BILA|nr:hypothetical protein Y032_0158g3262 [Ancylostoma ceylanicum]